MFGRRGAPKTGSIATDEMGRRSETAGDAYFKHAHHRLLQQCTGAIQAKIHVEAPWRRIKLGPEHTIHMPLGPPRLSHDLGTSQRIFKMQYHSGAPIETPRTVIIE